MSYIYIYIYIYGISRLRVSVSFGLGMTAALHCILIVAEPQNIAAVWCWYVSAKDGSFVNYSLVRSSSSEGSRRVSVYVHYYC